jgi:Autographiviridae endonuclease VII
VSQQTYVEYDTVDGFKQCMKCYEQKPYNAFPYHRSMPDKLHYYCRDCLQKLRVIRHAALKAAREARKKEPKKPFVAPKLTPELREARRAYYLWNKYKISESDYDQALDRQNGRCAICKAAEPGGRTKYFMVDHDHETGQVRGLLCVRCNVGIGLFRDSPEVMISGIAYLAEWKNPQPVDKSIVTV